MSVRLMVAVIVGCILAGLAGMFGVWLLIDRQAPAPAPAEDPIAVRRELIAAFQNAPNVPPPAGVKELFDEFGACLKAGGAGGERYWDFTCFIREADRDGALHRAGVPYDSPDLRRGMASAAPAMMKHLAVTFAYDETEIRYFRWLVPDREGVVIARHRTIALGETVRVKMRWWVVQDGGRWRIYDFEDVSVAARGSAMGGSMITEMTRGGMALVAEMRQTTELAKEAQQALVNEEFEKAEGLLARVRNRRVPAALAPILNVWGALIKVRLNQPDEALELLAAAERELPDCPAVYELQAAAHSTNGDHDRAIAAANRYVDLIGPDDDICLLLGNSYLALDRTADAAREYRRALDDNSECVDALTGLRACLGPDDKAELGDRLTKMRDPARSLREVVDEALDEDDPAAARAYVAAARKVAPDHPETLAQAGRLALRDGDHESGIPLFVRALDRAGKEDRATVFNLFAREAVSAGKAIEAYKALKPADARQGFQLLAYELEDELDLSENPKPLDDLAAAHEKQSPDDAWIGYFKGTLAAARNDRDRAEALLAAAMEKAPDDGARMTFRHRRVSNLIAAGRAEEAYAKVGPRGATFQQIMYALRRDEDTPVLAKVLAAHAKAEPKDVELPRWRGEVHFRKGEYKEAVRELRQYLKAAAEDKEASSDPAAREQIVRSLLRLNRFDDARAELQSDDSLRNAKLLAAVITATSGDVERTEAELDALIAEGHFTVASFHQDKDLGAALRTEKFKRLLEKYPPPKDETRPMKKV